MRVISFAKKKFRPGHSYRLAEWNQLPPSDQEMLSGLYDEEEVYGIFQPLTSSTHLTKKVAYKEVALLYMHLKETDQLPHYLFLNGGEKLNETITQLVLDEILEIECEGNFASGTAAIKVIFGETIFDDGLIPDHLSKLSMDAIQYALLIKNPDLRSLSQQLYTFNTIPWDAHTKSKFYAAHSIPQFLFPEESGKLNDLLSKSWESNNVSEKKYWLSWWKKKRGDPYGIALNKPTFKLYISSVIDELPILLKIAIPILSASPAFSFKVGGNIEALLRPDKMVVYFENYEELMETALLLKTALSGISAHGVPFTAQIDEAGILSWGVDPAGADVLSIIESGSWRMKVADQLALAILQAKKDGLDFQESIPFIRAKLFSAGINIADWTAIAFAKIPHHKIIS